MKKRRNVVYAFACYFDLLKLNLFYEILLSQTGLFLPLNKPNKFTVHFLSESFSLFLSLVSLTSREQHAFTIITIFEVVSKILFAVCPVPFPQIMTVITYPNYYLCLFIILAVLSTRFVQNDAFKQPSFQSLTTMMKLLSLCKSCNGMSRS